MTDYGLIIISTVILYLQNFISFLESEVNKT